MALLDRLHKPTALFPADFSDARCTPLVPLNWLLPVVPRSCLLWLLVPFIPFVPFVPFVATRAFELAIASCTPLVAIHL